MTRRKVSPGHDGDPSVPRARKGTSPKMGAKTSAKMGAKGSPKTEDAPAPMPRARRATRQKTEQFQLAAPTEVGIAPTGVGRMSRGASANRDNRVRERAYLLAEQNGFAGDPAFYWRLAEHELLARA